MSYRISSVALILITFTILASCSKTAAPTTKARVIRSVRVFDGVKSLPTPADVTVANGKIQSVSEQSESYQAAEVIGDYTLLIIVSNPLALKSGLPLAVTRTPNTTLGPYEVTTLLGGSGKRANSRVQ
jgi:hypothetical protein